MSCAKFLISCTDFILLLIVFICGINFITLCLSVVMREFLYTMVTILHENNITDTGRKKVIVFYGTIEKYRNDYKDPGFSVPGFRSYVLRWLLSPYFVKTLKTFLFRNRWADHYKTWYVALGPQPIIICANDDPRLTVTYFTAISNFET